jgi:hypothetical protein
MAAVLIAILTLTVLGIPLVLALDRNASPLRILGLAFLYGTGEIYFVLLALSVLHIRWSLLSVTIAALILAGGARCAPLRVGSVGAHGVRPRFHIVDLFVLAAPIAFTCYASITALWEWDFWAIWGLKARVFLEAGGIDWRFLQSPWNTFAHPDYPLLVPFVYDAAALAGGGWSDRWLGLLFVAWALAFILVARDLAALEAKPLAAALVAVALSWLAVSRYVGLAEGALVAFIGAGVLFVRRALLADDDAAWRHGALLLGLAACTKNEGLAMLASAAIAVAIVDVRRVVRLWPAAALALPWLVLRALHHLPTDVVSGSLASRFAARIGETRAIFKLLIDNLHDPWLWAALLIGLLVLPAAMRQRERFVLLAALFQLLFYVGAYFVTPHDPAWHIATSWPRLTMQIVAPLAFAVMIELARHAEARSEQP